MRAMLSEKKVDLAPFVPHFALDPALQIAKRCLSIGTLRARPQGLSVSAARSDGRATEPGVGDVHHLHPDGARLRLPDRGARLVQPPRAVVAAIDNHGCRILRRDMEDALVRHGRPDIFNTDQGSQFTGAAFTGVLAGKALRSAWTVRVPGATTC